MEGKRFGFGLVAGLLVGLVVVGLSAGSGGFGLYGSLGSTAQLSLSTSTASSTVTQAATTAGQPPFSTNGGNSTTANPPPVVATTTQGTATSGGSAVNALQSSLSSLSSNVDSMPHQPLLSNAVIFIPVFVAFLLGAALYMASRKPAEEES